MVHMFYFLIKQYPEDQIPIYQLTAMD